MDFLSDLGQAIVSEFNQQGVSFPQHADITHLASRYFEMRIRRIEPVSRRVRFSNEIHHSLGDLVRSPNPDPKRKARALEAWRTVFHLRHIFESGGTVIPYLSERVNNTEEGDGLLWDYAIHHLHLSRNVGKNGFVERSDWLLFAIVADQDTFFVDVRSHADPKQLQWVRQDLLTIIHNNWPELTENHVLHSVTGDTVTDTEKRELRRKNTNLVHEIGGHAIAPLGGGTTADGHSMLCRLLADKLLHELEQQQRLLDNRTDELHAIFVENGMKKDAQMEFRLAHKRDLNVSEDKVTDMCSQDCFSRSLWQIGFAIIENNTHALVVV